MPDDSRSDAYPAIGDYAIIGDTRSAALISRHGSIDWLCWPRFNSRSVFARILDANRGGHFEIRPSVPFETERRYVDATNVLETTFITSGGRARVLDLMPALTEEQKDKVLLPFRELLRRIECIEGEVPVTVTYAPRPDYGRSVPQLHVRHGDTIACMNGPEVWCLRSDVAMEIVDRGVARAEVVVKCGERHDFALSYETHAPAGYARIHGDGDAIIDETLAFWRQWSS